MGKMIVLDEEEEKTGLPQLEGSTTGSSRTVTTRSNERR
jgi:hypothetical protein